MNKTAYIIDKNGLLVDITTAPENNLDVYNIEQELDYTTIVPQYDSEKEEINYFDKNKQQWVYGKKTLKGNYYTKKTGEKKTCIFYDEIELYTQIQPTVEKREGDAIEFIDNQWVYITIGAETSAIQQQELLEKAKIEKLTEFENLFAESKKITITQANNEVMYIDNRDVFLQKLELAKREEVDTNNIISYVNIKQGLVFAGILYFWKTALIKHFSIKINNFTWLLSEFNKTKFLEAEYAIKTADTIEKINTIKLELVKPQGVEIDVQQESELILSDVNTSSNIKQLLEARKGTDGYYRLFHSIANNT